MKFGVYVYKTSELRPLTKRNAAFITGRMFAKKVFYDSKNRMNTHGGKTSFTVTLNLYEPVPILI